MCLISFAVKALYFLGDGMPVVSIYTRILIQLQGLCSINNNISPVKAKRMCFIKALGRKRSDGQVSSTDYYFNYGINSTSQALRIKCHLDI